MDDAAIVPVSRPQRSLITVALAASLVTALLAMGLWLVVRQPAEIDHHGPGDHAHAAPREACVRALAAALATRCEEARRALDSGCTGGPGHFEAQHEFEDHCER